MYIKIKAGMIKDVIKVLKKLTIYPNSITNCRTTLKIKECIHTQNTCICLPYTYNVCMTNMDKNEI